MALSPMMQHYVRIKENHKDAVLFYRLGDFYEMFFEDAELCSRVLDLTLTGKDCGLDKRAPMCGIPYHAADSYIAKLIEHGYKVAICEQLTEPKRGELVQRDVIRTITPGTVIDSELVDDARNNYLASIYKEKFNIGLSYLDITTGEMFLTEFVGDNSLSELNDALVRIKPSEILCNNEMKKSEQEIACVKSGYVPAFQVYSEEHYDFKKSDVNLKKQLGVDSLKGYNCATRTFAICSTGGLLDYVFETQKRSLSHLNTIKYIINNKFMQLDANTRRNLELTETMKDRKKRGSILWLLNQAETKMGSRTVESFISQPLFDDKEINYRLKGVEELVKNVYLRETIKETLHNMSDLERLCGKLSYGNINAKECLSLKNALEVLPELKKVLSKFSSQILVDVNNNITEENELVDLLQRAIDPECSANMKDGRFIKQGFNAELDEINNIAKNSRDVIVQLEQHEREVTGIKNLKIGYNRVFGYYIEVTNGQKDLVPYNYVRKQTTTTAERYITEELKNLESKILNAQEKRLSIEFRLFDEIKASCLAKLSEMQVSARAVGLLDAILSFATVAVDRNYVKPIIDKTSSVIEIIDGRHPIVEAINKAEDFVPNDTILNNTDCRTMIITGPNMAGKSTYMRQVAIITLMAHIGSFVPAKSAKIGLTDRIFTRVGASDDLSFGQSTFMVEMSEVSNILKNATNNSLIILDEVGRGTSTFDGLSIAWSVMEYVSNHLNAKTLFATHYHELTELEGILEGVKNYRVSVKEYNNSVIFLRKIVRGGTNRSFGIEVASLAGLPEQVVERAREILKKLEQSEESKKVELVNPVESKKQSANLSNIVAILTDLDVNTLTPLNAFDILIQLKNEIKD